MPVTSFVCLLELGSLVRYACYDFSAVPTVEETEAVASLKLYAA